MTERDVALMAEAIRQRALQAVLDMPPVSHENFAVHCRALEEIWVAKVEEAHRAQRRDQKQHIEALGALLRMALSDKEPRAMEAPEKK